MIPVTQTKFGSDEGNCFSSCIASILHADLSMVPNFCCIYPEATWMKETNKWLYSNYRLFLVTYDVSNEEYLHNFNNHIPDQFEDAYTILTGPAPRGFNHSVVGKGLTLAHDPHPRRDGLLRTTHVNLFVAAGSSPYMKKQSPPTKLNPHTRPWSQLPR